VLSRSLIGHGEGFDLVDVRCAAVGGWSEIELVDAYTLVLVRRGCFHRWTPGGTWLLDAGTAYFERPGDEQRISHPQNDGDTCTAIVVDETLLAAPPPQGIVFCAPPVDLLHRRLLEEPSIETVVALVDATTAAPRPRNSHRRLVDGARELLDERPGSTLEQAARALAVSAPHLSRVFRAETGETFARYRNRLRVRVALERVREGEASLTRLAIELGFSDHAHLTRTVKRETGLAPRAVARPWPSTTTQPEDARPAMSTAESPAAQASCRR
jgi:AraC-like DNA-binding protein